MSNKHIQLVKKWLADPKSVSDEELKANIESADAECKALDTSPDRYILKVAAWAARAANMARYDDEAAVRLAAHWVKKYEELTNDPDTSS